MNCPQCKKSVEDNDKFCAFCGAALIPDKTTPKEDGNKCKKCGEPIYENDKFCGFCGESVLHEPAAPKKSDAPPEKNPHILATFFGYIHILIGMLILVIGTWLIFLERGDVGPILLIITVLWFGLGWLFYGIYLWSRKHNKAKFHGKIVFFFSLILMFASTVIIYLFVE
jgi:hypothetical protein